MTEKDYFIQRLLKKKEENEHKIRQIFDAGQTKHSHAELSDYLKCFSCQLRMRKQDRLKQKMGVGTAHSYLSFRKKYAGLKRKIETVADLNYRVRTWIH